MNSGLVFKAVIILFLYAALLFSIAYGPINRYENWREGKRQKESMKYIFLMVFKIFALFAVVVAGVLFLVYFLGFRFN